MMLCFIKSNSRKLCVKIRLMPKTIVLLCVIVLFTTKVYAQELPPILLDYATHIVTEDGSLVGYIGEKNRVDVRSTGNISKYVLWSLIATEDRNFYEHDGVSYKGLGRAILKTLTGSTQGGSTITMQLARNLFLTHDRTISRKITEIDLAKKLEEKFSKDQILLLYLNTVYFGQSAYGIWAAAQEYFSTTPEKLTIAESAALVGLLQSPTGYNPDKYPQKLLARRNEVLYNLVEVDKLTKNEFNKLKKQPLDLKRRLRIGRHFAEQIRRDALTIVKQKGLTLTNDQLKITSTLDMKIQLAAEEAVTNQWNSFSKSAKEAQVALVSVEPGTGKIKALVGGNNESEARGINRAMQIYRQPGSSFKMFLYGQMLEQGYTLATPLLDLPIIVDSGTAYEWKPQNADDTFTGKSMPLISALQNSVNLCAAYSITELTSPDSVVSFATRLGFTSTLYPYRSLSLGTSEVSPLEMAAGAAVYAAEGLYAKPYSILKIEDKSGKILYQHTTDILIVLDSATSYLITKALQAVVDNGTGAPVRKYYKGFAAGKTGTTQNATDVWFVGYNSKLSTAIWAGYDNPARKVGGGFSYGGTVCAPIWGRMYADIAKKYPRSFSMSSEKPSSIIDIELCEDTGLMAVEGCLTKKAYPVNSEKMPNLCPVHSVIHAVE